MKGLLFSIVAALAAVGTANAQVPAPASTLGRNLAATCANCHGTGGLSVDDVPSLAGVPKDNIVRAMKEFKSGTRTATVMHQLAKGYTDEQIEAMAAWFAAQKPAR